MYIPKLPGFLYPNHARWKGNYNKPYTSIHQKLGSIFVLTQTEAKLRLEGPRAEIEIWQPMPCWPIFGTSVLGATCMLVCWGWFGLDSHLPHFFVGPMICWQKISPSNVPPSPGEHLNLSGISTSCLSERPDMEFFSTFPETRQHGTAHSPTFAIGKGAWKADCRPQGGATPWQGLVVCDFTLHSSFARRFADSFLQKYNAWGASQFFNQLHKLHEFFPTMSLSTVGRLLYLPACWSWSLLRGSRSTGPLPFAQCPAVSCGKRLTEFQNFQSTHRLQNLYR